MVTLEVYWRVAGDTKECTREAWGHWWRVLEGGPGAQGGVAGAGN